MHVRACISPSSRTDTHTRTRAHTHRQRFANAPHCHFTPTLPIFFGISYFLICPIHSSLLSHAHFYYYGFYCRVFFQYSSALHFLSTSSGCSCESNSGSRNFSFLICSQNIKNRLSNFVMSCLCFFSPSVRLSVPLFLRMGQFGFLSTDFHGTSSSVESYISTS